MKTTLLCTATALTLALGSLLTTFALPAAAANEPETELVLQGKKPARFTHKTHTAQGMACGTCHHDGQHAPLTSEVIAAVTDPATLRCLSCHNDRHPKEELRQAKDVFHGRCKTCHEEGYQGKKGLEGC